VQDLPTVGVMGNDVLDLVRTLPGIQPGRPTCAGEQSDQPRPNTMVAGISAGNVQVQRDGVDATQGVRWPTGISSSTVMNSDLIGEVRMILAPVDAEVARGQISNSNPVGNQPVPRRRGVERPEQCAHPTRGQTTACNP